MALDLSVKDHHRENSSERLMQSRVCIGYIHASAVLMLLCIVPANSADMPDSRRIENVEEVEVR